MVRSSINNFLIRLTVRPTRIPIFAGLLLWLFIETDSPAMTAIVFFIAICFDTAFIMIGEQHKIATIMHQAAGASAQIHTDLQEQIDEIKEEMQL